MRFARQADPPKPRRRDIDWANRAEGRGDSCFADFAFLAVFALNICSCPFTSHRPEPGYAFTIGHAPSDSGRNASSAGVVPISLYRSHSPLLSDGCFTSNR